ncbi:MAG: cupin domain-containing protein [Burkholderiales bacterium]|nr:cupin domain-containing protein [Burkholderiales bacterium]
MTTLRPQAVPMVQIDNSRISVTQWNFVPGAETGWHRHEFDYVVVPQSDGRLKIEAADGKTTISELRAHQSYYRAAGVEHNVINDSLVTFAFVEIEIK